MSEKVFLKVVVLYILKARVGAVNYYDKPWRKGTLIITETGLYLSEGKAYAKIPIAKITDMKREVLSGSAWKNPGYPVMSIRHYAGDSQITTLISTREEALERIRKAVEMQGASSTEVQVSDTELRLLILLYTGISSWNAISAILDMPREKVGELFDSLRSKGLIDSLNNLTSQGSRLVRKSGKI